MTTTGIEPWVSHVQSLAIFVPTIMFCLDLEQTMENKRFAQVLCWGNLAS